MKALILGDCKGSKPINVVNNNIRRKTGRKKIERYIIEYRRCQMLSDNHKSAHSYLNRYDMWL